MKTYEVTLVAEIYGVRRVVVKAGDEDEAVELAKENNEKPWMIDGPCCVAGVVSTSGVEVLDDDEDEED